MPPAPTFLGSLRKSQARGCNAARLDGAYRTEEEKALWGQTVGPVSRGLYSFIEAMGLGAGAGCLGLAVWDVWRVYYLLGPGFLVPLARCLRRGRGSEESATECHAVVRCFWTRPESPVLVSLGTLLLLPGTSLLPRLADRSAPFYRDDTLKVQLRVNSARNLPPPYRAGTPTCSDRFSHLHPACIRQGSPGK